MPNGVNSRYAYFADNTLAQVANRSLTMTIISQHDYLYDAYANRYQAANSGACRSNIPADAGPRFRLMSGH